MNIHKNACLTPIGREHFGQRGIERAEAGGRRACRRRTARKWLGRFQAEGLAGL